ncbi:porin family protein [Tamlana sp. I1]|uniref:porin family protein n=1 Tax=Tamlana sp. I1 TaxID=2762061 RepID=UPI00188E6AF5|nr:porin family protein [Tamlana sp. I1]
MKHLFILPVLFLLTFKGFSQDTIQNNQHYVKPDIKFGVRGGFNISNLDFEGDVPYQNDHRLGVYIGFLANIGLSKGIAVAPELQFSAEGASVEELQFDYIQMPILFRFRLMNKLHAGLGPQIGLKVDKVGDNAVNMAYSGVVGVDYEINYAIFVDMRYTYGLRNVFEENSGFNAKNRNLQIGVGYKF